MNEFDKIWNETMGCGACKVEAEKGMDCEDCISRESIRQLIYKNNDKYGYSDRFHEFTEECLQLPSVTSKQKVGRWEKAFDEHSYWYKCSCCGEKIPKNFYGNDYFSPYCPECGSYNGGEDE